MIQSTLNTEVCRQQPLNRQIPNNTIICRDGQLPACNNSDFNAFPRKGKNVVHNIYSNMKYA